MTNPVVREVKTLAGGTARVLRGSDLSSSAAVITYFSAISLVPWLLLGLWSTSWGAGEDAAERRLLALRVLVPPDMGGRPAYDTLVFAGSHLGVVGALIVLFPASFYGEGLRRGALALTPGPERFTGWRARLMMMPLVLALPPLTWAFLAVGDLLAPLSPEGGGGGAGNLVVRIVVGFLATWLVLSVVLTWIFWMVMPRPTRWWVAAAGALTTGTCLAGFLQGFLLFLSIPVDVGIPYGGLGVVGGVAAVGLWLYVLHVMVLLGWAVTCALEERVP